MAGISSAANRYAEAIFGLAVEENAVAQWAADLAATNDAFGTGAGLAYLTDRKVPDQQRFALIEASLAGAATPVRNLVKLMTAKGRGDLLPQVAAKFAELSDAAQGIAHARVTTAVDLDAADRAALTQRLNESTGKRVEIETDVAPEILGGIVVRIGDALIDGSARTRLVALKRQLEGAVS